MCHPNNGFDCPVNNNLTIFCILHCRVAVAGYCSKIYKVPSDDVSNVHKYKEAPIVDKTKILSDDQTLRDRENQSKYISIPVEVSCLNETQLIVRFMINFDSVISNLDLNGFAERFNTIDGRPRRTRQITSRSHFSSTKELNAERHQQLGHLAD